MFRTISRPVVFGALATSALAFAPAFAQTADQGARDYSSNPDELLRAWQDDHGDSWHFLTNSKTGTLEMLYGGNALPPFEPNTNRPEDWYALGRHFIALTRQMHGIDVGELVDTRFRYLPLGTGNTTDKVTVRFEQFIGGVPVENGFVNVLFDTQGRLLSIHVTGAPEVQDPRAVPTIDAGFAHLVAASTFENQYGVAPTEQTNERLVHAFVDDGETRRWALAWEVEATFTPEDDQPIGQRYTIDAHGRNVLKQENTVHNFDVFGTISSMATPGLSADRAGNPEVPIPMPRVRIQSSAGTIETDRDGNFNFPGVNTPLDLTVTYFGQFTDIRNDAGADYTVTFNNVQPNSAASLLMNPGPQNLVTAQANVQLHINVLRDYIKDRFPGDTTADFRATGNCNLSSTCNAFFNGGSVNFYQAGGGCNNTAFSSVVAHEMGHWLNVLYGTGNGGDGMGEGNADVFAMYCYDDPIVGRFFTTGGGFVRTGTNNRQYCGDGNGGCYGGVHADGEVWMGAAWKVRENLNASLGNTAGDQVADNLFLGWLNSYNQTQITSTIEIQWLTLDDDNGNINDGTPNHPEIDGGFTAQGFPGFDLPFVTLANVTELDDTTSEAGPYTVQADATTNLGTNLASVEVFFRSNGGSYQSVLMSNVGGDTFSGDIPGQVAPSIVDYYVLGTDDAANTERFPENGDLQFRVGTVTPVLVTDFESGQQGWTGGAPGDDATTGQWTLGNPNGTAAQPEDDFSNPGTNCWFTGQANPGAGIGTNDVDDGRTTLLSPIFDADGAGVLTLQYARWYSNNQGGNPNADIFEVEVSTNGGSTWTDVETVGPGGNQSNGDWFEVSIDLASIVTPSANMQLRFIASDLGGGSIVEAAIDDVEVTILGSGIEPPTRYCTANANSTGIPGRIDVTGSQRIQDNDFLLITTQMPVTSFGLYFFGDQQTQSPVMGSQGNICVAGSIFRLPAVQSTLFGTASLALDFTDPNSNASLITAGSTWNFQMWFRDSIGGMATSNFTDGIEVEFGG